MKLIKNDAKTLEDKLTTSAKNLKKVSAHAIKILDQLENKEISVNQARIAQRLIADSIRAELGAAMLDNQLLTDKTIPVKSK